MSFPASKTNRKKVKKDRGGELKDAKINLVSLIDVLTVLLAFLLQSFSVEGNIVTPSEGLVLPASTAKKMPELALRIGVSVKDIMVEGSPIADVSQVMASQEMVVPALQTFLEQRKETTLKIAQNSSTVEFKGDVIIEADKQIRFDVLERVIYTCGQVGYSNFALLVNKRQ